MARQPALCPPWLSVLLLAALTGCQSDALCLTDDPHTFVLHTTDRVTGVRLEGISGTVKSDGRTEPIRCYRLGGVEQCFGWARGRRFATVRVERDGYLPWDTLNVPLRYEGDACRRPVEQVLDVQLTNVPSLSPEP
jgi:hypothetical protein